jgi:hypothetical protein
LVSKLYMVGTTFGWVGSIYMVSKLGSELIIMVE